MKKNLPNILTFSRGFATICIIALFLSDFQQKFLIIYWFFIFAIFTDFFDGLLARHWQLVSDLGTIFDPLFDKVLVLSLLLLIYPLGIIPATVIIILFLRDVIVDSLRSFMLSKNVVVPAIKTAKAKTASQMLMLNFVLLFLLYPSLETLKEAGIFFSIIAVLFSLWSGVVYANKFVSFLKKTS